MIKNIYLIKLKGKDEYLDKTGRKFAPLYEATMIFPSEAEVNLWIHVVPDDYDIEIAKYKCELEEIIEPVENITLSIR